MASKIAANLPSSAAQIVDPASEFLMCDQQLAQVNEGAHDGDVHANCSAAAQHRVLDSRAIALHLKPSAG